MNERMNFIIISTPSIAITLAPPSKSTRPISSADDGQWRAASLRRRPPHRLPRTTTTTHLADDSTALPLSDPGGTDTLGESANLHSSWRRHGHRICRIQRRSCGENTQNPLLRGRPIRRNKNARKRKGGRKEGGMEWRRERCYTRHQTRHTITVNKQCSLDRFKWEIAGIWNFPCRTLERLNAFYGTLLPLNLSALIERNRSVFQKDAEPKIELIRDGESKGKFQRLFNHVSLFRMSFQSLRDIQFPYKKHGIDWYRRCLHG